MSKRSRPGKAHLLSRPAGPRPAPVPTGPDQTPVEAAVERVAQHTDRVDPPLRKVVFVVQPGAYALQPGESLELTAPPTQGIAVLLVQQNNQPWVAVTMPPSSVWVLSEKQPADALCLPGGRPRPPS
jgi:hypothetical protein